MQVRQPSLFLILKKGENPNIDIMKSMKLTIHYADCVGENTNCVYPHCAEAENAEEFKKYVAHDHVFFTFADNRRGIKNFISTCALVLDCDNDHSDSESDWITDEKVSAAFPGVAFISYSSRNDIKPKGERSARPRRHYVFPVEKVEDPALLKGMLQRIQSYFPYFDSNAFDAGRFFYGSPEAEVAWHEGEKTVIDYLDELDFASAFGDDAAIPKGTRNSTMHSKAVKLLKRYGESKETLDMYLKEAEKCSPPLEKAELKSIWESAAKFYKAKIATAPGYKPPEEYNSPPGPTWDTPIPFDAYDLPQFPVEALPKAVGNYVSALAESTQTPVDMAATAAIPILATCIQGKYKIRGKADWIEPLNIYAMDIMAASERKSAVENAMTAPINNFEYEENIRRAADVKRSESDQRVLLQRQKWLEDQAAKGKGNQDELDEIAKKIADFKEYKPLKLYSDDVTTEKLASVLSANGGRGAIISSEGGIFDYLSGIYTTKVNIDIFLKAYSGDTVRVERIGRPSESIPHPTLSILLMAQPSVLSGVMQNSTFRGRGLTARFLYSMPASSVGRRKYRSKPVPDAVRIEYERCIYNLLEEDYPDLPELITLSPEADMLLEAFAEELEPKLKKEYADIQEWAGKLVGNVLRIAGIFCRASTIRFCETSYEPTPFENKYDRHAYRPQRIEDINGPLVVDAETMENAIKVGRYYIEHALAAFSLMGADAAVKKGKYVINAITSHGLTEFNRRDAMRICKSIKTTAEIQPILDLLEDYGYIATKDGKPYTGKGRPPMKIYLVNPFIYGEAAGF